MFSGSCSSRNLGILVLMMVFLVGGAIAAPGGFIPSRLEGPVALALDLTPDAVQVLKVAPVDIAAELAAEKDLEAQGLPPHFAVPEDVALTPAGSGTWQDVDEDWVLWRQRITAPGALSINLGFSRYRLPKGGRLTVYPADMTSPDDGREYWTFTERNNEAHGQLWTPLVLTDDLMIELLLPRQALGDYELVLESVNKGYRYFGEDLTDKAGTCNVDVVCPEGDPWRAEIATVAVYTLEGYWTCTGAMINNTAEDQTPYFLTANHCGINSGNASTMVVYWNFESPTCGQQGGGSLADNQSGATFLATSSTSDFCLVELNDPPDPAWSVAYAGWYRGSDDPASATAIHHPNTDEKSISFEYDPTSTTTYLEEATPGDGTHIRITDWDVGTTEPGSSGSPLFNPDHRIVGQLHGGYAACDNDLSDWYGRFSVTWPNVAQWLDPLGTAPMGIDTFDPNALPFQVSPQSGLSSAGDEGGPFTPDSKVYTLENAGTADIVFQVTSDVSWALVTGGTGTLAPGATTDVTVTIGGTAGSLGTGSYEGVISFVNLTDGAGDTTRPVSLQVGVPELVYSFPLDTDPGWAMDLGWAFGVPQGGGGDHGDPDPVSGYTGSNVLGYNLAGDYENNILPRRLFSAPIDCRGLSGVTVRFRRWLGVEQPAYDHASFAVSNDSVNITTIWTNGAEINDGAWTQVEYDISAVADDQEKVYLVWIMGETDGSWQYCGWNIDDIEIWGLRNSMSPVTRAPAARATLDNYPNPFNPLTKVSFNLPEAGKVTLGVYDVQGRLVNTLADGEAPAGRQSVIWDGTDSHGRQVSSGIYFARLITPEGVVQHKMILVK